MAKKKYFTNVHLLTGKNLHQNLPYLKGEAMNEVFEKSNAWFAVEDEKFVEIGEDENFHPPENAEVIDLKGGKVIPGFCDSHTHIVYAGSREAEFVDKIKGLSYEEIARRGGGIINSSALLQKTSEDELFAQSRKRLEEIISYGTCAVEIKSGYGLTLADELKMLRVIKRLKENYPVEIKATLLAAHALPLEFKNNREKFIKIVTEEMVPNAAAEHLADFIDVFCDKGFFTVEETDTILNAASKHGLTPKIHANELDYSGGIQVGVKNKALSVDHLEFTGEAEIKTLMNSGTMPTLLPSTAFFLKLVPPPARTMLDAGLPVALASDYNPGSSPSGRMQLVLSLACILLRMTPEEALNAATINSAYAMNLSQSHGSIEIGKKANFIVLKDIPSLAFLPYAFGTDLVDKVFVDGEEWK
jgi:imidazolonepropionase